MSEVRKSLPIYFVCSGFTAGIEFALGWFLLQTFPNQIVVTNIAAILVSSVVHYVITTKYAFGAKRGVESALVYVITFVLGIVLQNAVIWFSYERALVMLSQPVRYVTSKALSLGIPFFALYFLRKSLNERFASPN